MPVGLPVFWVGCAFSINVAAIRSQRHPRALRLGRYSMGVLYVGAGAAVNAGLLVESGDAYRKFADGAYVAFVRDAWHSLVMPNRYVWISLLIAFELAVGVLALLGGRFTQLAHLAAIAFHVALLSFGWGFYFWSPHDRFADDASACRIAGYEPLERLILGHGLDATVHNRSGRLRDTDRGRG